jgi:hypothetical protein
MLHPQKVYIKQLIFVVVLFLVQFNIKWNLIFNQF